MNKIQLQKILAQRILARRDFLHFVKLTYPTYQAGWVHEDICRRLERFSTDVVEKKSPRLMLLMPPRHGKLLADDIPVLRRVKGEHEWATHGTLRIGDEVMGLTGWVKVIGISRPGQATHELVTTAGTRIACHLDHEWALDEYCMKYMTGNNKVNRRHYAPRVVETRELLHYRKQNGPGMWSASSCTMRRFYFPTPDMTKYKLTERIASANRRYAPNGGRLAVADIRTLEVPLPGRCIQIDAPDGVYLVTRDFVPTHNSELASIRFPAWHLGHHPKHEIVNVGYNLDLPMVFSRKVRELARDAQYHAVFPEMRLSPDSQATEAWQTTTGGGFVAVGIGGGLTGKGAHILCIDDPIRNIEDADNPTVREKLWDWYQSVAYTRLAPGGGVLLVQTCWHDADLAGRLIEQARLDPKADQFEIVRYPALSDAWEYATAPGAELLRFPAPLPPKEVKKRSLTLLRSKGECLHAERYDTSALERIRANMQPRLWSALYQQNPVPEEGVYFRKEDFRKQIAMPSPYGSRIYTAWDFAIGEKQTNDWTVGATLMQDPADVLYVMDVVRFRGGSLEIAETMLDVALRWGSLPGTGYLMGVEDGQIWRAIEPIFRKRGRERKQSPSLEVLRPLTDKLARARVLQGRMQQGRVVFPEESSWLAQAQQELLRFPGGVHDDVVDALAWAARLCMDKPPPRAQEARKLVSWRDRLDALHTGGGSHLVA